MTDRTAAIHFVAGGVGGTAGVVVTCPLEVVKVRMQSSAGMDSASSPSPPGSSAKSAAAKLPGETSNGGTGICRNSKGLQRMNPSWAIHRACGTHASSALPSTSTSATAPVSLKGNFDQRRLRSLHSPQQPPASPATPTLSRFGNHSLFTELRKQHFSTCVDSDAIQKQRLTRLAFYRHFRHIIKTEGWRALWKGLVPNVIGVAPSKAVYFYAYSTSKRVLNGVMVPESAPVHICSAAVGGFLAATAVNPIWLVKTRLQLDRLPGEKALRIRSIVKRVFREDGIKGFYRGVTASYAGISETIIQFVIYEYLKQEWASWKGARSSESLPNEALDRELTSSNGAKQPLAQKRDIAAFMFCGGTSKLIATIATYPHEVCRTRLREEGSKYRGFFQTFSLIVREERFRALYKGLSVHLLRTVPNTAISFSTYEAVVILLSRLFED